MGCRFSWLRHVEAGALQTGLERSFPLWQPDIEDISRTSIPIALGGS